MLKIKVGEKCVLVADGANSIRATARAGVAPNYYGATITKVGREYFYVMRDGGQKSVKFSMKNHKQVTNYCADYSIHESWEEYLEAWQNKKATDAFKSKYFNTYSTTALTVDQIRRITEIIEEGNQC